MVFDCLQFNFMYIFIYYRYSAFLARFPYIVIILVLGMVGCTTFSIMTFLEFPDFTDPTDVRNFVLVLFLPTYMIHLEI